MSTAKKAVVRQGFKTGEHVVYPSHGVGQITAIEEQEVAGFKLELFVVSFAKDKMTLRVPTAKAASVGLRKLADAESVAKALTTLTGRARVKRTMWSRRAQEYEAKINSGDLVAIAEVVRDLYRSEAQPEQSYSERQLYEAALDRMTREIAVTYARRGIRANALCPGAATASFRAVEAAMPEMVAEILTQVPMGYMGDPDDDIAGVVAFLASDDSRYLTGNTLFVDGGGHINGVPWAPDLPD